jgi:hypothetical protein
MSHKIPLMVAAALAALLVLTAVQARGPNPLVDVGTTIDVAGETSAGGTITVCNETDHVVEINTIDDMLFYKQGGDLWAELAEATVSGLAPGVEIGVGNCAEGSWAATYNELSDGALRNVVGVTIVEKPDKVFYARECFHFE